MRMRTREVETRKGSVFAGTPWAQGVLHGSVLQLQGVPTEETTEETTGETRERFKLRHYPGNGQLSERRADRVELP